MNRAAIKAELLALDLRRRALREELDALERHIITRAFHGCGSFNQAAQVLGEDRTTLSKRAKKYFGITAASLRAENERYVLTDKGQAAVQHG
jgi:transcriptional regulator with GAF, ATPase, and Fis domain